MQLSRFNDDGIKAFQSLLQDLREGVEIKSPLRIIEDILFIEPVSSGAEIIIQNFETRLELAVYINTVLKESSLNNDMTDIGLWAWLSAVFIDTVCPPDENGRRIPNQDYRHIPTTDYRNFYRHLIRGAVRIYRLFSDNVEAAEIVLCQTPSVPGEFVEQLGSRQERITNPAIISAANRLYLDKNTKKPKIGAAPNWKKPGTLRRYIDLLNQLDLTYDLYSMNEDDILTTLPSEFSVYRG